MGESKRRKNLDPNYGATEGKADSRNRFKISLKSEVKESWVTVEVIDTITLKEAVLPFHLYTIGTMSYAEVGIKRENVAEHGWVIEHIDTLSPMICQLVYSQVNFIITSPSK
jgi:hypothetical protein